MTMYTNYWGLRKSPFVQLADERYFFESATHVESIARLDFLVENNRRLGLLLGPGGCGKTMLLRVLAKKQRRKGHQVVTFSLLGISGDDFLAALSREMHLATDAWRRHQVWQQLADRMIELRYEQRTTVVLLDDASDADPAVFDQVLRLLHFAQTPEDRLSIVLAADNQWYDELGSRLLDRVELRSDLEPWTDVETFDYLEAAMTRAGGHSAVFERAAADRLHALGDGLPRRINQLAELTLLAGAGHACQTIDAPLVDSVFEEFSVR